MLRSTLFKHAPTNPSAEQKTLLKNAAQIVLKDVIQNCFKRFANIHYTEEMNFYSKKSSPTTIEVTLLCQEQAVIEKIGQYLNKKYQMNVTIVKTENASITPPQTSFRLICQYLYYETMQLILNQSTIHHLTLQSLEKVLEFSQRLNNIGKLETNQSNRKPITLTFTTLLISSNNKYFITLHQNNENPYRLRLQDKFKKLLIKFFGEKIIIDQEGQYYLNHTLCLQDNRLDHKIDLINQEINQYIAHLHRKIRTIHKESIATDQIQYPAQFANYLLNAFTEFKTYSKTEQNEKINCMFTTHAGNEATDYQPYLKLRFPDSAATDRRAYYTVLDLLKQHNIVIDRTTQDTMAIILEEEAKKITRALIAKIINSQTQDLQNFTHYLQTLLGGEEYVNTAESDACQNFANILFTHQAVAMQCCKQLQARHLTAEVQTENRKVYGQHTNRAVYIVSIDHACQANEVFKNKLFLKQLTDQLQETYVAQLTKQAPTVVLL